MGHTSGATPLAALEGSGAQAFGLHPLQTFAYGAGAEEFRETGCAIAGSTPEALALARRLAETLGMNAFEIDDEGRAAYHAAASIASNFLVTLQHAAEQVAAGADWSRPGRGPARPPRRSHGEQPRRARARAGAYRPGGAWRRGRAVASQQRAVARAAAPHLLPLFDKLVERTRDLAKVAA